MGLSRQAVFDSTTVDNGDSIAAYVFGTNRLASAAVGGNESLYTIAALSDGAGTALTSTLVSAKQSLDVNVTAFPSTAMHVDGTVADGSADSGDPVKIGMRAVSAVPSAASNNNRVDAISDLRRRMYVNTSTNVALKVSRATVGTSAASLVTALTSRQRVVIQNRGSHKVWIGFDNTVTADDASTGGIVVDAHNGNLELPCGDGVAVYAISDAASQSVFVLEAA